jgi:hypothetical protein
MTDYRYTEADAAFDNEQQGGCPWHGLNHPECTCERCPDCGWIPSGGKHAPDCDHNPERVECPACGFLAPLGQRYCDEECKRAFEARAYRAISAWLKGVDDDDDEEY